MAYIMQVIACDDNIRENYKEVELYDSNFLNTEKKLVSNLGDTIDNVVSYINSNIGDRYHISVELLNDIANKQVEIKNEIYVVERNLSRILSNNKFCIGNSDIELLTDTENHIVNNPTYNTNSIINQTMFEKIVKSEIEIWERIARIEKYCISYFEENEYSILGIVDDKEFIQNNIGNDYFGYDTTDLVLENDENNEDFDIILSEYGYNFTFDNIANVEYDIKYNANLKFADFVNTFTGNIDSKYKLSKTKGQNY